VSHKPLFAYAIIRTRRRGACIIVSHGIDSAMKGLTLNYMDRKIEVYDLVQKGLKVDPSTFMLL
jgi:hypothetical protein